MGTADIGQVGWCEQKATFEQERMEWAFSNRAIQILGERAVAPSFVTPNNHVLSLEVREPGLLSGFVDSEDSEIPSWMRAELNETRDAWHMGLVASFAGKETEVDDSYHVILVGIPDGILGDGTVVEVRQSKWDWIGIIRNRVVDEKQIQANIYAWLLGLPRWRCVFHCRDGRHQTEGPCNPAGALQAIRRAAQLRLGVSTPSGPGSSGGWKCTHGRCDFLEKCTVSPARTPARRLDDWD